VGQATLHNEDEVARKDVRIGDTVIVRKAGDVIPEVVGPVRAKRRKGLRRWKFPKDCPACGQPLVRAEGESATNCVNVECPAQRWGRIVHFAAAMDIDGLGEERVRQFIDAGLLSDPADIYWLDVERLVKLDRIGEKSAQQLVDNIQASKSQQLARLLVGLSIPNVGGRPRRTSPARWATSTRSSTPRPRTSRKWRGSGPSWLRACTSSSPASGPVSSSRSCERRA
jgi:DNA ligase (NAD+)